jgi:hypothetical protein
VGGLSIDAEEIEAKKARERLATMNLLRRLDANKDGRLSFEEFAEWYERTSEATARFRPNLPRLQDTHQHVGPRDTETNVVPPAKGSYMFAGLNGAAREKLFALLACSRARDMLCL